MYVNSNGIKTCDCGGGGYAIKSLDSCRYPHWSAGLGAGEMSEASKNGWAWR